jgi:hypothetical protein
VDTVLCGVGKALAASIHGVLEAAGRSSQQLEHARGVLHIAIDSRFEELLAGLSDTTLRKVAALERELAQLDEVLESTRREHDSAREAAASLDDAQLEAEFPSLLSRLGAAADVLAALPLAPIEIAVLHVDLDLGALLDEIAHAGVLVAPLGVSADQLVLRGLPESVRPGRPLHFEVVVTDAYLSQVPAERAAAVGSIPAHLTVDAVLELAGGAGEPVVLHAQVSPASSGRGVDVLVPVPAAVPGTSTGAYQVTIRSVAFAL